MKPHVLDKSSERQENLPYLLKLRPGAILTSIIIVRRDMDRFIERIYLHELITQCENAVAAVQRMNALLATQQNAAAEFFREAADFLQHTSAASRLLWPHGSSDRVRRERAENRGAHLRTSLGVDGEHVLRSRRLRDHLEHYDERIDDWAETSPNKNIVDNMIGPRSAIGGDAIRDTDIMRLYDPSTKKFVFRGESFDVQELVSGVIDIRDRAVRRLGEIERV